MVSTEKLAAEGDTKNTAEQNSIAEKKDIATDIIVSPPAQIPVAKQNPGKAEIKTKEPVSDVTDASQLTVKQLRKFIPFLNDWAFKQTNVKGIQDYFVENNSFVNFKLSKNYSDSVDVFHRNKRPQLIDNYWKSLNSELGPTFPKVQIEISFLRFDADL